MSGRLIKDLETAFNINEDDFMIIEQYDGTKKIKVRTFKEFVRSVVSGTSEEINIDIKNINNSMSNKLK